jgi:glycosyltransferase involved in cell wall biosynthesis
MKLSVVIPVYNEKSTILEVLRRVRAVSIPKEVIIIDDFSTDGTRGMLQALPPMEDTKILYQSKNAGKGAALRAGFACITGNIVVIQDADLEYNPAEYDSLIQPILSDKADVVFGSRFREKPRRVRLFWHGAGNFILTTLSNMFTKLDLTDMETCYKAFRSDILKNIKLRENRFGFEPEFTAKISKARCRVYEVPISYNGRGYSEGKKLTWKDGISAIYSIVKYHYIN